MVELIAVLFAVCIVAISGCSSEKRMNVLFVVADDLRTTLGCYGNPVVQTPYLDELAKRSIRFTTAATQQAVCAPSRTSFLTGRRPDTTKLFSNTHASYWRETAGNFTTLPQHFKNAGYVTVSVGKVFHPGRASNFTDDYPYSWSQIPYHPSTHKYKNAKVCPGPDGKLYTNIVCPVDISKQPEGTLPDIQSTQYAIKFLESHSVGHQKQESIRPFFLAVGYHKPHIPLKYPREFLNMYPLEKIHISPDPFLPYHLPLVAYEPWTDIRWRDDIAALNLTFPFGNMPELYAKKIIQSYYAATSYMDSLVGDLLQALKKYGFVNNTVISFVGDHGWSLGEHLEWSKFNNFRVATNIPFMVHVPGLTDSGRVSHALVELVDLFPTLSELCGLGKPALCPEDSSEVILCSEGLSFGPIIRKPSTSWKKAIFSQYPRPSDTPQNNTCEPSPKEIIIMGYSMQTEHSRYTEWIQYNHVKQMGNWSNVHARELYLDRNEDRNMASVPKYSELIKHLSSELRKGWRNALPGSNIEA